MNIRLEHKISTMNSVYFLIVLSPKSNISTITRAECPCAKRYNTHASARSLEIGLLTNLTVSTDCKKCFIWDFNKWKLSYPMW